MSHPSAYADGNRFADRRANAHTDPSTTHGAPNPDTDRRTTNVDPYAGTDRDSDCFGFRDPHAVAGGHADFCTHDNADGAADGDFHGCPFRHTDSDVNRYTDGGVR